MPAVGLLKLAVFVIGGRGEGALAVAEEFTFDQIFGDRRTIHLDKRFVFARTCGMDRMRDQFFASAGFAIDQAPGHWWAP